MKYYIKKKWNENFRYIISRIWCKKFLQLIFADLQKRKQKEETKNEKGKSWGIDLLLY